MKKKINSLKLNKQFVVNFHQKPIIGGYAGSMHARLSVCVCRSNEYNCHSFGAICECPNY